MRHLLVVLVLFIALLPVAVAQERLTTPPSTTTITLGNERTIPVRLTNPLDEPDIYTLSVETTPTGAVSATFVAGKNGTGDREQVRFRMGPEETRTVNVAVTASSCYGETCSATVTVRGRSLETNTQFVGSTDVVVNRDRDVRGASGLTGPQILLILVAGAVVLLR